MPEEDLNWSRIACLVSDMKQSVAALREYGRRPDPEFLGDDEAIFAARYRFIVLAEAAAGVASHICARFFARAPESYAEAFRILGENDVLREGLAERLGRMCGFRNLLVHRYADIDDGRMLAIIRGDLGDIDEFIGAIERMRRR